MNRMNTRGILLCFGILLLLLCSTGIGSVAAANEVNLGDVYLNALYENLGSLPIAGNEDGWTNTETGTSVSFMQEDETHYSILDRASSATTSTLPGTYEKGIGGTTYRMYLKYPTVPITGYIYLKDDLTTPVGHLMGTTISTAYSISISVPATLGGTCKVTGIALTNPDNSLTRIVGTNTGNTIVFTDSLATYDAGVWTVTPVFQSGIENGFATLAPSYMYGTPAQFTVKLADTSVSLTVSKATTPVPTQTHTATPTVSTPVQQPTTETPSPTPLELNQQETPINTQTSVPPTQDSPVPLAGVIAGLGAATAALWVKKR